MICLNYNVTTPGHLKSMEEMLVYFEEQFGNLLSSYKTVRETKAYQIFYMV